jgi:uncharacterized protein (DUF362 family)
MAVLVDRAVGIYHFLGDRTPRRIPSVDPKPRKSNPWLRNDQPVVSRVRADGDVRLAVVQAIESMGGLKRAIGRGDRVLVKPNFNSPDLFPASTDLAFLQAVVELILEGGAGVTIGESSGCQRKKSSISSVFPS